MAKRIIYPIRIAAVCAFVFILLCSQSVYARGKSTQLHDKAGKIKVVKKWVNYYDPAGKRPVVLPENLPPSPAPKLPPAPKIVSPGYKNDPQDVYPLHVYQEPDGKRIVRFVYVLSGINDTKESYPKIKVMYQLSKDGGKTISQLKPLIQQGKDYNMFHPIEPVYVDKNGFCLSRGKPVRATNGEIMVPIDFWPLDEKGNLLNPVDAYTYSQSAVLIGKWTADSNDIIWNLSDIIKLPLEQSTRGGCEITIIELTGKPGHFLNIIRTSNEKRTDTIPGYKYISRSSDYCRTWSKPVPLTYSDGTNFYSPSLCSEFHRSLKSGRLYWIGNISAIPPMGNWPRYPLIIAEVDEDKAGIIKESVTVIDDRNPEIESDAMELSNFIVYESPKTGQIVVRIPKRYDFKQAKRNNDKNPNFPPCYYILEEVGPNRY